METSNKKAADRSSPLSSCRNIGRSAVHISGRRAALMPHPMRRARVMTPCLVAIDARRRRLFELGITHALMVDAEHAFDAADHTADRRADDRADRARDAVALMKSICRPARDALRLRAHRS